jgi:hypothetical protein
MEVVWFSVGLSTKCGYFMDGLHFPVPVVPILTRFRVFCVSFGCFPVSQTRFRAFRVSFWYFPMSQTRFRAFRVSFGCFPVPQTRFCAFRVSFGSPGCKYTEYL